MLIKDVERFTIPIQGRAEALSVPNGQTGTTAEDLIRALKKVPGKSIISTDYDQIIATHYKPDIDPDVEVMTVRSLDEAIKLGRVRPRDQYSFTINRP